MTSTVHVARSRLALVSIASLSLSLSLSIGCIAVEEPDRETATAELARSLVVAEPAAPVAEEGASAIDCGCAMLDDATPDKQQGMGYSPARASDTTWDAQRDATYEFSHFNFWVAGTVCNLSYAAIPVGGRAVGDYRDDLPAAAATTAMVNTIINACAGVPGPYWVRFSCLAQQTRIFVNTAVNWPLFPNLAAVRGVPRTVCRHFVAAFMAVASDPRSQLQTGTPLQHEIIPRFSVGYGHAWIEIRSRTDTPEMAVHVYDITNTPGAPILYPSNAVAGRLPALP